MEVNRLQTDVLVIGGGAAGCRAAIEASDRGARVVLAAKGRFLHAGSTFYPLTIGLGYTTAPPGGDGSGPETHYREIIAAGQGMASPTLARILAEEAPGRLQDLIDGYGLAFLEQDGQVLYIKPDFGKGEVRAGGATADAIREAFGREIRRRDIRVLDETAIVQLLGSREACLGAVGVDRTGDVTSILARATVLATGGGSPAFLRHMNTPELTFDGHGMALHLGAELVNMEFYQTILGLTSPVPRMLIPESLLALEPPLSNGLGQEFLSRYLPEDLTVSACLRTRAGTGPFRSDNPARYLDLAIFDETRAGRGTESGGIQADFTRADPRLVREGRLGWYEWARARGVDLCAQTVDISPHVHAFNGGVLINAETETSVPGLFACGEVAGGPHGANRIGGNQFAGTQVFGKRAGHFAAVRAADSGGPADGSAAQEGVAQVTETLRALRRKRSGPTPSQVLHGIQTAMWEEMGVHKDAASLSRCLQRLSTSEEDLQDLYLPDDRHPLLALSLPHLLAVARVVARAASMRRESRGPHYRTDAPSSDDSRYGKPLLARAQGERIEFEFRSLT